MNLKSIKRFNIMMRSFFGDQQGPFSLSVRSISAVVQDPDKESAKEIVVDPRRLKEGASKGDEAYPARQPRPVRGR